MKFLPLLSLLILQNVLTEARTCKCFYGQPCWPSSESFTGLASNLSQPLLSPTPPALACYSSDADSTAACADVQANTRNGTWRSNVPGAMQNVNFEAYIFPNNTVSACYLSTTLGFACEQGAIPPVGVDARNAEDVQAAVRFARRHNLKVVVHNTGHDYLGRSTARGAFMIWTHWMKSIEFNDKFTPEGAPSSETYDGEHEALRQCIVLD